MLAVNSENPPKVGGTTNWSRGDMPNCDGFKAFVLPGAFYGDCVSLMAEAGFEKAVTVEDADVVVFIGGADINPALYGQKCHKTTSYSSERDTIEEFYYNKAIERKVPMFGICRGAQFLHAMNGGQLWQDVNGHAGPDHMIVDIEEDVRVEATSLHHQMLQANDKMTIIAVTEEQIATEFESDSMIVHLAMPRRNYTSEIEIEAGAYLDTRCFFVQGHPEIGSQAYRSWAMHKLHEFLIDWLPFQNEPDIEEVRSIVHDQIG